MTETKNISSEEKVWAAVSYLWVGSLFALAARKNNEYVRFHANQGVLLFAISLPTMFIPLLGWLINLVLGILAIIGIVKALQGEKWVLPVGANWAKQLGDWVVKTFKL